MSDYDFSTLNDKDFEELVVDLLSAEFKQRIERFKPGKDGGVDGRFYNINGEEQILQCKHWIKSGVPALINYLSSTEFDKVRKLDPSKYFLITSLPLSKLNKTQIKNIFGDYIEQEDQILGKEDLNDLLKKHNHVERTHYKLWASSTAVLETILNADVLGTSRYKVEEINRNSKKYVITESHHEAIHMLDEKGSIIISGLPGIGKTTLADQICRNYLAQGFEFYYIEDSISNIEKVYNEERTQIFYFDDFLGSNYLEALHNSEDSKIAAFIRRVERNKTKRFILTSRTNILNQGKRLSTAFEMQNIQRNEYELILENLKSIDKAKILYNHIFFSNLSEDFINELYLDERYRVIINHKDFNPRIISFITDSQRLTEIKKEEYWFYIETVLKDPSQIWGNVFDRQTDGLSKEIISVVVLNKGEIEENKLKEIYHKLCHKADVDNLRTFNFVMKALTGSLVNRNISRNSVNYTLFNPSIADYIVSSYFPNKFYVLKLIRLIDDKKSIASLIELVKNGILNFNDIKYVLNEYLVDKIKDYKIDLIFWEVFYLIVSNNYYTVDEVVGIFNQIRGEFYKGEFFSVGSFGLFLYLIKNNVIDSSDFIDFIDKGLICYDLNEYTVISNLSLILKEIKLNDDSNFAIKLKSEILDYLYNDITSMVIMDGVVNGIYSEEDFEEYRVLDYISEILKNDFPLNFDSYDVDAIFSCLNVGDAIEANMNTNYDHEYEPISSNAFGKQAYIDPITDLFDRS